MSFNYKLRDQYRGMSHAGTPNLCQTAKLQRIRDINRGLSATSPDPKFKEVTFLRKTFPIRF